RRRRRRRSRGTSRTRCSPPTPAPRRTACGSSSAGTASGSPRRRPSRRSGEGSRAARNSATSAERQKTVRVECGRPRRSGGERQHGGQRAGEHVGAERELELPGTADDQNADADEGAQQVTGHDARDPRLPPEPAEVEADDAGELHVPNPKPQGEEEGQREERGNQHAIPKKALRKLLGPAAVD